MSKRRYQRQIDKKQNREIKRLKTDVKSMKKIVERKHWDSTYPSASVSTTATALGLTSFVPYNTLDQTRRQTQREGQSVSVKRIQVKGTVEMPLSGVSLDVTNRMRMIIVHTPESSTPTMANIIEGPLGTYNINAFNKIQPPHPYRILFDRTWNMQTPVSGSGIIPVEKWRHSFDIRLGKKALGKTGSKCDWVDGQANIQIAPDRGAITLFVYSDSNAVTHPVIAYSTRITFEDL